MKYIKKGIIVGLIIFIFTNIPAIYGQSYKIRILKKDTYLYLRPSLDSIKVVLLPLGAIFDVEEIKGEWVKTKLPQDRYGVEQIGFILLSSVELKKQVINGDRNKELQRGNIPETRKPSLSDSSYQNRNYFNELTKAKANRSLGITLTISGAVVFIPCIILTFADKAWSWDSWSYKARTPYIIGDAIGLGAAIIGLAIWISADSAINQINDEIMRSKYSLKLIIDKNVFGLNFSFVF